MTRGRTARQSIRWSGRREAESVVRCHAASRSVLCDSRSAGHAAHSTLTGCCVAPGESPPAPAGGSQPPERLGFPFGGRPPKSGRCCDPVANGPRRAHKLARGCGVFACAAKTCLTAVFVWVARDNEFARVACARTNVTLRRKGGDVSCTMWPNRCGCSRLCSGRSSTAPTDLRRSRRSWSCRRSNWPCGSTSPRPVRPSPSCAR